MPTMDFRSRLVRLRRAADLKSGDGIYISALPNVRYFSGFSGSAGVLLVTPDRAVLLTDGRYEEWARNVCGPAGIEVDASPSEEQFDALGRVLAGSRRLFVDPSQVTVDTYDRLKEFVPTAELVHLRQLPERLRLTKDAGEVARIRAACQIALAAFADVPKWLEDEVTERSIANRLEGRMKELGAEDIAFSSIVASGPNSAKPHSQPGDRVIQAGEPVIIDFGAMVDGYHSDITRTIWLGDLRDDYKRMYEAAVAAEAAGVEAVGVGVRHSDVDAACRRVFELHGFSDKPLHPSGHNVGLSIHERPYLSAYADEAIGEGYVLAVEPGLYRPSEAGFRIEDTVVVHSDGVEVLSRS